MAEIKADLSEKDKKRREMSLNAPMWRVVLYIGAPLALYNALGQLFTILDTMMASYISAESVSAVAYLGQLNSIISALGGGLAVGAGIQISRAFGMGDYQLVRRRVSSLYAICLGLGIAVLVGILPFTTQFLRAAGTPEELIAIGRNYFIVQLITLIATFLDNVYIAVERSRGNSKRILYLNLMVIAIKLTLTAVFVYILNSGLVMIAVASLISQLALLVFAVKNSISRDNAFGFSAQAVTMKGQVTMPMITQSIPVILEKALFAFGKTIVNSMSTMFGATMVGAMGVSNNLGGITTQPQNGFQDGTAAIISQNYGAGRYKRVLEAFYACCVVNMILGAVISGFELWQLHFLSSMFAGGDEVFREKIAMTYAWEAYGAIPLGANAAVMALLYGLGKTKLTMVINVSRIFLFRIPVFYYLSHYTSAGEHTPGLVMFISNTSVAAMSVVMAAVVIHFYRKRYIVVREKAVTESVGAR